jgi:hypothetical protein
VELPDFGMQSGPGGAQQPGIQGRRPGALQWLAGTSISIPWPPAARGIGRKRGIALRAHAHCFQFLEIQVKIEAWKFSLNTRRLKERQLHSVQLRFTLAGLALAWWLAGSAAPTAAAETPAAKTSHWAFQPPIRPAVPAVRPSTWPQTPVDAFILARLQHEKLSPSPRADRATLLRRLSLDLTGLPPTVAELDAYLATAEPDAYDRAVERLLTSPHYGERWGRLWLDAARYADSNGYEKDRAREMWHYRDWVVNAFNRDLPYDRFLTAQLAGDLLPNATQEQRIATGFLRNSMVNEEGAIDPEQFRMDAMFDRMDCLGKAVLGLTIQCAQCHDHKYDPFRQADYYRVFAFLNNADDLIAPVYSPDALAQRDRTLQDIGKVEADLRQAHPDWAARMDAWAEAAAAGQPEWTVLEPTEFGAPDGLSKLQLQKDQSLLAGGHPFTGGTWFVKAQTILTNITAVRLELLTNGNLPMYGPGRSGKGLFALREFRLKVAPLGERTNFVRVAFDADQATTDFGQAQKPDGAVQKDKDYTGPIRFAVDGNDRTSWTIDAGPGRRNADRKAVFPVATNFGYPGGTELSFELACQDEVACLRLAVTSATHVQADPLPRPIRALLKIPAHQRTEAQTSLLFSYWRTTVPEFAEANSKMEAMWKKYPEATGQTLALCARREPRDTAVLKRGDWLQPGLEVTPGLPAFLNPPPPNADGSRLTLARWLVDGKAPTTARVFVNRTWQAYFGTGLVDTPEDFGLQGSTPSHRELLDWLACEFMEPSTAIGAERLGPSPSGHGASGDPERHGGLPPHWSIRHLHRLLVHSAAYQQSAKVTPALEELDPANRLLARGPRFRVDGESVRDIALAASGLLQTNLGGPSLFTPAPAFLFVPPTSYQEFPWKDVSGSERYRRALYTFRRRSTPYPMLQTFDAPNGDSACVRRARSNTPLQALTSLNEPLFVDCARALAKTTLTEGGATDPARIGYAFRRVLSRPPTDREQAECLALLERERTHIGEGWVNPSELATGASRVAADLPPRSTPTQLAAYTVLSRVLLNLDEAITKE